MTVVENCTFVQAKLESKVAQILRLAKCTEDKGMVAIGMLHRGRAVNGQLWLSGQP